MGDVEIRACHGDELRIESRGLTRVIVGHALVFDRLSENLGGFRERIAPSAIDRTLKDGVDLRALVDHDSSKILGRLSAGTLRVAKDSQGLSVEIDPPDTTIGQDLVVSIRRRDLSGMSFAFRAMNEDDSWWDFTANPPVRTVRDMLVREVSVVAFPVYSQTDVGMRSLAHVDVALRSMNEFHQKAYRGRPITVAERLKWSAAKMVQ